MIVDVPRLNGGGNGIQHVKQIIPEQLENSRKL